MLNTFDGKMGINKEGFKLYLCLYFFTPFLILFTVLRGPAYMDYRNELYCPLVLVGFDQQEVLANIRSM